MDKYGVKLRDDAQTIAIQTGTCPDCKKPLDTAAGNIPIPHCPDCGTYPFEDHNGESEAEEDGEEDPS